MRSEINGGAQVGPASQVTVRVRHSLRGRWEVVGPGRRRGITCETLDEARRVAYLAVAHTRPCELIVQDAYHRVVHHEFINGHQTPSNGPQPRGRAARAEAGRTSHQPPASSRNQESA